MATSPLDKCRSQRIWAKGAVTKVANKVKTMKSHPNCELDVETIIKQRDNLSKADASFLDNHAALRPETDDVDAFDQELEIHVSLIEELMSELQLVQHRAVAAEMMEDLEESLEAMERGRDRPYCPGHDLELARLTKKVGEFREARNKRGARLDAELRTIRDQALERLELINQSHTASKGRVDTLPPPLIPIRETSFATSRVKIPPPVFDGTIMGWKHFWDLFSALLDRNPSMADVDKSCLLVEAMGTPEAKSTVMKATAHSTSFDDAVQTLRDIYDKNRVVHGFHYGEMSRPDSFGDIYEDVSRMWDRIRDCKRGLTLSKGYSADQLMTAHFERMMKPPLLRRWMDFTPSHKETPSVDVLLDFLDQQRTSTATASTIPREHIGGAPNVSHHKARTPSAKPFVKTLHPVQTVSLRTGRKCYYCSADHTVFHCDLFKQMEVPQRLNWVVTAKRCTNCLGNRHLVESCDSSYRCRICKGPHHSLLHSQTTSSPVVAPSHPQANSLPVVGNQTEDADQSHTCLVAQLSSGQPSYPLPRTAIVGIQSSILFQKARAQLDSGASVSLITNSLARTIKAKPLPHSRATMVGVGGVTYTSLHTVRARLIGMQGEELDTLFHVVDSISATESLTDMRRVRRLPFVKNLELSDPLYTPTSRIDILMDMGSTNACFMNDAVFSESGLLRAQNSIFGWTVGGHDSSELPSVEVRPVCLKFSTESELEPLLTRFWEQEKMASDDLSLSSNDQFAITHFQENLTRDYDGRYRVSIPRRQPVLELGKSRSTALRRFIRNEASLKSQGRWEQFHSAIKEYGELDHAEKVSEDDLRCPPATSYYLPMHGVVKDSTTTKLRLVFDASARTSNGVSLNDTLLSGPSLYPLLTSVITRFRTHSIGMTSDISKMFREIGLNNCEKNYHRFLQRGPGGEIEDWCMSRLTFGVTTSPFLATQVLRQLADDYEEEFPQAANVVRKSFYVDDCLSGADNVQAAVDLRENLNLLCGKAKMTLRKWRSNSSELMMTIPPELQETSDLQIVSTPGEHTKTLGLHWGTLLDHFYVATPKILENVPATRRIVASIVAKTFDVMGWFSPAILPAKLLLKKTWIQKLGWDESLGPTLQLAWKTWAAGLPHITLCPIPRFMGVLGKTVSEVQLHGFSDSSVLAYGGVVYRRNIYTDGSISVHLVASKSRMTPLKCTESRSLEDNTEDPPTPASPDKPVKGLSIPRLELCGAVVLAQLLHSVASDLPEPTPSLFAWSDSSSVLGWMNKDPSLLSVYVSNRVVKVTALIPPKLWRYVETSENPADLLSRGMDPRELEHSSLWWKGPPWLSLHQDNWPRRPDINLDRELGEVKRTVMKATLAPEEMGVRISTYDRLLRVRSYVERFIKHTRKINVATTDKKLSLEELRAAENSLIRLSQYHFYPEVISFLKLGKTLYKRHPLAPLAPFLDEVGILRVGGRLQSAELTSASTHPVILNPNSHLVLLLVRRMHRMMMHAGPSTMMATLAVNFHIPRLRPVVRSISQGCIICQKALARTYTQLMGQLPALRTQPSFPFNTVGIDFAGPLIIKRGNPRHPTMIKSYICVFIDFTCRATHLEVVSDLTTSAFLAALSRFVGRRGRPSTIFSDNGTNFIGANAELRRTLEILSSSSSKQAIGYWAAQNNIDWRFSPARAPHFGGLWESTVKLAKSLIKKAVGDRRLNFEELSTFAISAEAVINSRPLVPLHTTSDDAIAALTPGHFLIGRPLQALPASPDLSPVLSHIRRWNLVSRLIHDFWTRWRPEYLLLLQRQNKWLYPQRNLRKGDIVLVKDCEAFQRFWPMGRVSDVYPGVDGLIRVVQVWSQGKTMKRPVAKLVLLLSDDSTGPPSGGVCSSQTTSDEGLTGCDDENTRAHT